MQALNWVRRQAVDGLAAVLADDPGLGKAATAVAFTQALRQEFKCTGPVLVVVPPTALAFWEGEFAFWAGQDCNVVTFAGSSAARLLIHEHELWLSPGSLDHRNSSVAVNDQGPKVDNAFQKLYPTACETVAAFPGITLKEDASLPQCIFWIHIVVGRKV